MSGHDMSGRWMSRSWAGRAVVGMAALAMGLPVLCGCDGRVGASGAAGVGGAGAGAGGGAKPGGGGAGAPAAPGVPVVVATVVQADVPIEVSEIGTIEAYETVTVKPQIAGAISEVRFTEGQDVRAGDPIFVIDPRPFRSALAEAEATLAREQALARDARQQVALLQDALERSAANPREVETAQNALAAQEAAARSSGAAAESARLRLEYTTIRAPTDGRTGAIKVNLGNVVKENDTVLVVINRVAPIYASFAVPERRLTAVRERLGAAGTGGGQGAVTGGVIGGAAAGGLVVRASVPGDGGAPATVETGRLTFIDNTVDRMTGTVVLKGTFSNEDHRLWPGQFVDVTLVLGTRPGAVLVPTRAVQAGQTGPTVFVVTAEGKAEARTITVGEVIGERTIVESGLRPGERVVTDGQVRLVPGSVVDIKGEDKGEGAAAAAPTPPTPGGGPVGDGSGGAGAGGAR